MCRSVGLVFLSTVESPEDTLAMLSFNFLFTGKPTPACPLLASEWYSRWPLWSCETSLFFGLLQALSRPISCCFLSVLLPVLARVHLLLNLVMFLHCMLQSSVALPLCRAANIGFKKKRSSAERSELPNFEHSEVS